MTDIPDDRRRTGRAGRGENGVMDPNTQIASRLRAFYRSVEQEPIPDMFLDLLEKLDKAEKLSR